MIEKKNDPAVMATAMLQQKLSDWRDGPEPGWPSTWPIFERLIARRSDMVPVWEELASKNVTGIPLWLLTEHCIFAAMEGKKGENEQIRADYRELQKLNKNVADMCIGLAQLIERRDEVLNRSGHFHVEHMFRLTDMMDAAGRDNHLYNTYIRPELEKLSQYDLKYWPDLQALLRALSEEEPEIEFRHKSSEAIALARPSLRTDFLRNLFDRIRDLSDGSIYGLHRDFRLSDASLATLCNVACDLSPDDITDSHYIRQARQRLRQQGYQAVW